MIGKVLAANKRRRRAAGEKSRSMSSSTYSQHPLRASLCEFPASLFELRRDKTTRQVSRDAEDAFRRAEFHFLVSPSKKNREVNKPESDKKQPVWQNRIHCTLNNLSAFSTTLR
jgi:hypothetical protein